MKVIEVTAAVIQQNGRFLICQRPENKNCGLLWEFPGGKIEPGESGEQCIVRECEEELGVTLHVDREITDIYYDYPDRTVHLHFYSCSIVSGVLERKEHNAFAWISPDEIENYEFCPADKKMLSLNVIVADNKSQDWLLLQAHDGIPKEIVSYMQHCFQIMEIRAKVGTAKSIVFEVRTRENNHVVPHIHASYDSYSISIEIETGKIFDGNLPKKQQNYAVQWVADHKQFLLNKWRDLAITAVSCTTKSALDMRD